MFVEGNPAPTFKFYKVEKIKFNKIRIICNTILFKGLYFRGCKFKCINVEYRTLPVVYISLGKIANFKLEEK